MSGKKSVLTSVLGFDPDFQIRKAGYFLPEDLYHSFDIRPYRNNRKTRTIFAPCEGLKTVQKAIHKKILVHFAPHPAATAYYYGRSIASNARQHLGYRYLYKTDVSNFFPSITASRIQSMLGEHFSHLSQSAINEIVRMTTHNGTLPQGAPTSPHLANLLLYGFDDHIFKLCDRIGARYTRYADDIAVSAQDMEALLLIDSAIRSSLAELGLSRHPGKTRFLGPNVRKIVTGLDVSGESIRPSRKYRKKTAALIRICEMYPIRATLGNLARIKGHLLYWKDIAPDDPELVELAQRLRQLEPCDAPTYDKRHQQLSQTISGELSKPNSDAKSEIPF